MLNGVVFMNRWASGRTPAKDALRLVRDVNLFLLSGAALVTGVLFLFGKL